MTIPVINYSLKYLLNRHYPISPDEAKVIGRSLKQVAGNYASTRGDLWAAVYDAVYGFLTGKQQVNTFKSPMSTAVAQAYIETSDIAYVDGGGELPMDEDSLSQSKAELDAQLGYVDNLFSTLKALRKEGDFDPITEAFAAANRWTLALDGFFNSVKFMGAGNKMLTWNLGNTERHCDTCLSLNGQRHRASWYIGRNYIPKKPGSNTDCGGYHCDCSITDDNGVEFTI